MTSRGGTTLGPQASNWLDPFSGGPALDLQLSGYTGTYASGAVPAGTANKPYWVADGYNGAIMLQVQENNVGTATCQIEGSYDGLTWLNVGYYAVVSAGVTATTLDRAQGALAVARNSVNVLRVLDAYPLLRVRPSVNAGSISAGMYALPT